MNVEYEDYVGIKNTLTGLLEAGYTIPMIEAVLQRMYYVNCLGWVEDDEFPYMPPAESEDKK